MMRAHVMGTDGDAAHDATMCNEDVLATAVQRGWNSELASVS